MTSIARKSNLMAETRRLSGDGLIRKNDGGIRTRLKRLALLKTEATRIDVDFQKRKTPRELKRQGRYHRFRAIFVKSLWML